MLTLAQRCEVVRENFGIRITPFTLRRYYLMAGVKFNKIQRSVATAQTPFQQREDRLWFLKNLHMMIDSIGRDRIWYFDEVSAHSYEVIIIDLFFRLAPTCGTERGVASGSLPRRTSW